MKKIRCDHGLMWEPLGEFCTNNWCKLKRMIRAEYHELSELPFFERLWVRFNETPTQVTKSWQSGLTYISQTHRIITYKGNDYFYKWGTGE